MTRYIFVGAGAIGSGIGGCLAAQGSSVVLVARQAHVEAINAHGLRLRTPDDDTRVAVPAVTGPDGLRLDVDDVLVLTTKTHQATAALAAWADVEVYRGDQVIGRAWEVLPVLTALNGVDSEQLALRYFRRVFAVCVWMPAVFLEPGEVLVRATPRRGIFHIGAFHPPTDADDDALLERTRTDWSAAGCEVMLTDQVMAWKYRKLISNMMNVVQALVAGNGEVDKIAAAVDAEARAVLDASGIAYIDDQTERAAREDSFEVAPIPGEPAELGGSSWQSLARGSGSIETDYLNGEIARLAREHGVRAPLNEKLASMARVAAVSGQRPGALSAADLESELQLTVPDPTA